MNLLLVVAGLPDSQTPARSVFNLVFAKELQSRGINIQVIYLRAFHPLKKTVVLRKYEGISVLEIRGIVNYKASNKIPGVSTLIFEWIIKTKRIKQNLKYIDVVHAISGNTIEAGYILTRLLKKPLISQFIGSDVNTHLQSFLMRRNFISSLKKSSIVTFNSQGLRKVFFDHCFLDKKTKVIYRGVKLAEFDYSFQATESINILFLGGFPSKGNLKGGHTLLKALELLDTKKIRLNLNFVIGGPLSEHYVDFKKQISHKKINLQFIGAIDRLEVKNKMKWSNIVLIPSLAEGIPNVLFESMASGNMVIASEVGGIPEILDDKVTGRLISPDCPAALADVLFEVTNNLSLIEHYAINGRKRIESLDYDKFIDNYILLYKTVTNLAK